VSRTTERAVLDGLLARVREARARPWSSAAKPASARSHCCGTDRRQRRIFGRSRHEALAYRVDRAALFAAAAHPERFASVIVGTGGAAVPLQLGEPLASWVLDPDLDKYRRMDPRAIVDAAVDTIAGGIPDDIRDDYRASYDGDRFVESMRYVRRYPEELPELAELLPQVATSVTIINGRHDRVVPLANAEFLDERLPNSRLRIIDAGHFVWEEAPAEYASIILDAVTGSRSTATTT
jgi:pimeloyl-ACP methyl ester carboxylesterase